MITVDLEEFLPGFRNVTEGSQVERNETLR